MKNVCQIKVSGRYVIKSFMNVNGLNAMVYLSNLKQHYISLILTRLKNYNESSY